MASLEGDNLEVFYYIYFWLCNLIGQEGWPFVGEEYCVSEITYEKKQHTQLITYSVLWGSVTGGCVYVSATTRCPGFRSFISLLACEKFKHVSIAQ